MNKLEMQALPWLMTAAAILGATSEAALQHAGKSVAERITIILTASFGAAILTSMKRRVK